MQPAGFKPVILPFIFVAITLVASSCATRGDLRAFHEEMQAQNSLAESRLTAIEWSIAMLDSLLRDQNRTIQGLRALSGTQAQEQRDDISVLMARQEDINYQLRELGETLRAIQLYGGVEAAEPPVPTLGPGAQQSSAARAVPSPSVSGPQVQQQAAPSTSSPSVQAQADTSGSGDPETLKLFESALTDLRDGNYLLAESLFLSFLMQYPNHQMAGDAQFWLGEAAYGQGKYDLAISEFRKVPDRYPTSGRIPAALLRIGEIQIERDDARGGAETLNRLITTYPNSDEASQARVRLNNTQ